MYSKLIKCIDFTDSTIYLSFTGVFFCMLCGLLLPFEYISLKIKEKKAIKEANKTERYS